MLNWAHSGHTVRPCNNSAFLCLICFYQGGHVVTQCSLYLRGTLYVHCTIE